MTPQICPYCNGTTLDLSGDSGGSCPNCFGGYIDDGQPEEPTNQPTGDQS